MTQPIDLRSDTLTKPTPGMREAIFNAPVGDDVFGEDPTVLKLEARVAEMLGKEAAILVPSGTMSNQIAVRVHCGPGDELICEWGCHIYNYEQGGCAQLSGVSVRPVAGESGIMTLDQIEDLIRPENEHLTRTKLLCLENTQNRGGGRILPYDNVEQLCGWAHEQGLKTHLDGARLMNAVVASGISVDQWAQHFDTVSLCFSKGLGAPVGSALIGSKEHIAQARRHRKVFGGGMRQAGILAAGALYALENQVERLAEDHQHAQIFAQAIKETDGLSLQPAEVDTNIVIFAVDPKLGNASQFSAVLKEHGLLVIPFGRQLIRAVTHLDVSKAQIQQAATVLQQAAAQCASGDIPEVDSAYV